MNDTTRRFLNTVLERVPESRIVEVRLFPAIRQGGIESGVAVFAVEPEAAIALDAVVVDHAEGLMDAESAVASMPGTTEVEVAIEHPADAMPDEQEVVEFHAASLERASAPMPPAPDLALEVLAALERESVREVVSEGGGAIVHTAEVPVGEVSVDMVAADLPADASAHEPEESIALGDLMALPSPGGATASTGEAPAHRRLAILCARYKLVFKGPDRGKWDLEIMHQADAPLDTLDRVISGVMRRSGEGSEPQRFTQKSLRESLDAPVWAQSA